MDILADELNALLKPSWGSEKWILEGWRKLTSDEKQQITDRLDELFKNGLPFSMDHDKILYVYLFAFMAQLEVLGIQLPNMFEDKLKAPDLRKKMRAQLLDEIFHAILFTKIVFMLSAPHQFPPAYNQKIENICKFVRELDCSKVSMVVINLLCEGIVEEVFSMLHQYNIAPRVFKTVLDDEHRHVSEAELYQDTGLPDPSILEVTIKQLEDLVLEAFSQPAYFIPLRAFLGNEGMSDFLKKITEKHTSQLKKLGMTPSDNWDLAIFLLSETQREFQPNEKELYSQLSNEFYEQDASTIQKALITQLQEPRDPTITIQFNLDITDIGFFDEKYPQACFMPLMLQTISYVLSSNPSFRNWLRFKKIYQSQGAYVTLFEKPFLEGDDMSAMVFRDCHELSLPNLLRRMERNRDMMHYCFKKREQAELDNPKLKKILDDLIQTNALDDIYPCPIEQNHTVYICNLGAYGYTQAKAPLLKQAGLCVLLLAIERKQVWNPESRSFTVRDFLPISISADTRIYNQLQPVPKLVQEAFQIMLAKLDEATALETNDLEYDTMIEKINLNFLCKKMITNKKIAKYLLNKKIVLKGVKKFFGDEAEIYANRLSLYTNYDNPANQLLLGYLGFDTEQAQKEEQFIKLVDKLMNENPKVGYQVLLGLQSVWLDYFDVESSFNAIYASVARNRLSKLAELLPKMAKRTTC